MTRLTTIQKATILTMLLAIFVMLACHQQISLRKNCVAQWPVLFCYIGNAAGLASTVLWFSCLVPQVLLNFTRKSVVGLSIGWSVANFSASIVNLNFILRLSLPSYVYMSGVYMPVLEAVILAQFCAFEVRRPVRCVAAGVLAAAAAMVVVAVIFWERFGLFSGEAQWVAVFLWSVETFPQIWLNHERGNTHGQAPETMWIAFVGKTTDFIGTASLNMPAQSIVKAYFSTCTSYLNFCQFSYYSGSWTMLWATGTLLMGYSLFFIGKVGWLGFAGPIILILGATKFGTLRKSPTTILDDELPHSCEDS